MNSKRSLFNTSVFKADLKRFWPAAVLLTVMMTIVDWLTVYQEWIAPRKNGYEQDADFFVSNTLWSFHNAATVFFTVLITLILFFYLFSRYACNFEHAMPVTRGELFLTRGITAYLFCTVPQLTAAVLVLPELLRHPSERPHLPVLFAAILVMPLFETAAAIFCVMLTGHFISAAAAYMLLNFGGFFFSLLSGYIKEIFVYGYNGQEGYEAVLSPPVELPEMAKSVKVMAVFLLLMTVLGLLLFFFSFLLYKKRSLECAGNMFAFKCLAPVARWIAVIFGGLTAAYIVCGALDLSRGMFAAAFVFFAFIAIIVAQMAIRKSARIFRPGLFIEWAVGSAVIVALLFGLSGLAEKRLLVKPGDVSSVMAGSAFGMQLDDQEDIRTITEIQSIAVANKREYRRYCETAFGYGGNPRSNESGERACDLYLEYTLKNGKTVCCNYALPVNDETLAPDGCLGRLAELETPERFFDAVFPGLTEENISAPVLVDRTDGDTTVTTYQLTAEEAMRVVDSFRSEVRDGEFPFRSAEVAINAGYYGGDPGITIGEYASLIDRITDPGPGTYWFVPLNYSVSAGEYKRIAKKDLTYYNYMILSSGTVGIPWMDPSYADGRSSVELSFSLNITGNGATVRLLEELTSDKGDSSLRIMH
ncbi:MAG: hypothetical protein K6G90_11365 [Clostridia bacterium]|nr:hypothetical protein [Clostridia bacterium]